MNLESISLKENFDTSGSDRLSLLYESDEDETDEFYTLCWESHSLIGWQTKARLTGEQFQGEHNFQRWIADLHSIQPENGLAVILVAEGNREPSSTSADYTYSWRLWDIVDNIEVMRLKDCHSPFEKMVYQ